MSNDVVTVICKGEKVLLHLSIDYHWVSRVLYNAKQKRNARSFLNPDDEFDEILSKVQQLL